MPGVERHERAERTKATGPTSWVDPPNPARAGLVRNVGRGGAMRQVWRLLPSLALSGPWRHNRRPCPSARNCVRCRPRADRHDGGRRAWSTGGWSGRLRLRRQSRWRAATNHFSRLRAGGRPGRPTWCGGAFGVGGHTGPESARLAGRSFVVVVDRDRLPAPYGIRHLDAAANFLDSLAPQDRVALWTLPDAPSRLEFRSDRAAVKERIRAIKGAVAHREACITVLDEEAHLTSALNDRGLLNDVSERECKKGCPEVCDIEKIARLQDAENSATLRRTLNAIERVGDVAGERRGTEAHRARDGRDVLPTGAGGRRATGRRGAAMSRVHLHAIQAWNVLWGMNPEYRGGSAMPQPNQSLTAEVTLAARSGGLSLTTVAGPAGFERLARQLSSWYVLGIETTPGDRDGRPQEISVDVVGRRVVVRARQQFQVCRRVVSNPRRTRLHGRDPAGSPRRAGSANRKRGSAAGRPDAAATPAGPASADRGAAARPTAIASIPDPSWDPALRDVLGRMAAYVSHYGEAASFYVASEAYHQRFENQAGRLLRPRSLTAEFALVRADDRVGWVGYRDVIAVDGKQIADRKDRLEALLTRSPDAAASEVARIVDESARFNIGPVSRNFNTPTTALLFFHPSRIGRFSFKSRGVKTLDGLRVLMLDFVETARPTLMGKRDGTDVPSSGSVWVIPEDGTVVRTRIRLRNFADNVRVNDRSEQMGANPRPATGGTQVVSQPASPPTPPAASGGAPATGGGSGTGTGSTGGGSSGAATGSTVTTTSGPQSAGPAYSPMQSALDDAETIQVLESSADIEVTFRKDGRFDAWLPWKMSEQYQGAIPVGTRNPMLGKAMGVAEYTNYRRFGTTATIVEPTVPR